MSYKIIFRSNINLKNISIGYNYNQSDVNVDLWASDIGASIFLFLHKPGDEEGGLPIDSTFIKKMKIHNNKFRPSIELIFQDPNDIIGNKLHPDDDTVISVFKKSTSKLLMPLRVDFVITKFKIIKEIEYSNNKLYSLFGVLKLENDITENIAYKGSSFSVLQQLSKKLELGFASNVSNANDEMTWINPGIYITEFIPFILKHSFYDYNSFIWGFIDLYYNLNYVNIEHQLDQNPIDQKNVWNYDMFNDGKDVITNLLLTNHPNMKGSNTYIDKYIVDNSARDINWDIGYDANVYYYNKTNNSSLKYQLDTISNTNNDENPLKSLDKLTNTRRYYMGKLDEDNAHKNFLYTKKQNENNIKFLQKIKMNIIFNNANMSLYRFQYIELIIYELKNINENLIKEVKTDSYKINEKLSGSWLITGISYVFEKMKIYQEITLVKRSLGIEYDKKKLDEMTKLFYFNNKN